MYSFRALKRKYQYGKWKFCCGCYSKKDVKTALALDKVKQKQLPIISELRRTFHSSSNYHNSNPRVNFANVQMISPGLHKQIFKTESDQNYDRITLSNVRKHLQEHKLWGRSPTTADNVDLTLSLLGNDIAEHFKIIAQNESNFYFNQAEEMASLYNKTPPKPEKWQFLPGWTKYYEDGSFAPVPVPQGDVLVFDVEVCLSAGKIPVIATALSKDAWYCWVSNCLFNDKHVTPEVITPDWMIPLENNNSDEKLFIGHNVSFDRSFVKEQYSLKESKTRFLDTLSLHVCVSGVTNEQRNYLNSKEPTTHYDWMDVGTTNSLAALCEFYCGNKLDKSTRDIFVDGTLDEIKNCFQECAHYCATDVSSTKDVFQLIWPMFLQHVPHPVTFAGMLDMGTSYLPINESWNKYIENCETMYNNTTLEMKDALMSVANEALKLMIDQRYKEDPWLRCLDWSIHKTVSKDISNMESGNSYPSSIDKNVEESDASNDIHAFVSESVEHLSEKRKNQLVMPGYPKWYRDLCMKPKDPNYKPGPCNISSQTKVTPSLLRMTWEGYPLHHEKEHGWGYIVTKDLSLLNNDNDILSQKGCKSSKGDITQKAYESNTSKKKGIDIGIPGVTFFRLPHKDGEKYNVGNPLAKDFLSKIEDGTLASSGGYTAKQAIEMNKMLSFWRNGRKRIMSQHTVWFKNDSGLKHGAILPLVISAGTVTRRAVEPTWLTASNPQHDRIGSELKSLVQAPDGYCLVGADVDSQELWIASVLGDSQFAKMHGSTALSWMTLQGNKTDRTDLHSRTADTIGMGRDQAKIFNYGRIYGAGEKFAVRQLMQFNHNLSSSQAETKAQTLYNSTKGMKKYKLTSHGIQVAKELHIDVPGDGVIPYPTFKKILNGSGYTWESRSNIVDLNRVWSGGSESEMFNKLESIALSDEPRTPVLGCLVTKALSPKYVHNHFKTSRVNWVVQSSAVDYLHLMLTCMRWLIGKYNIDARFCISVHDEVRYIVNEKDKYKAALALQISNLLTRSMFSYKLNLHDLPQSVAFFSSVDIDTVWRKEVDFDCVTPSNSEGLQKGYGICPGESLNINELLMKLGRELDSL